MDPEERELVRVYRALGDQTRLAMVRLLARREEMGCGELAEALDLTRPTLSYHTRILEESRLIDVRKEGAYRFYRLRRADVGRWAPAVLGTLKGDIES
ncbi:ArsR/SmtB family transcription factor [Limnochorda pilosa]|uniref:ArsR family transcriptional regulator n=1 Tax=Limnochorda pilosa TaxID=1555112 RepID=A0A0K2SHB7_LIMPI|nr:metalloregulator ArsR/SmtB family transcription factor [Limnochorda pilosa]BAS26516.1 ArsR family transcriptional regulator [Limnochorda pilosa]